MSEPISETRRASQSRQAIDFYHSATQFRFDSWHELEQLTSRVHQATTHGRHDETLLERIHALMEVLQTLEDYTAFPSKDDFRILWRLFERSDYEQLARMVGRIVRALSSHAYRRRAINITRNLDGEENEDETRVLDIAAEQDAGRSRPYFEVLVVDDISAEEERVLRRGLREMRRPEDPFIYDVVAVPSFEDALIATLFNYNIQTVVIRYGFPYESKNQLPLLKRYLAGIMDTDAAEEADIDRGPLLGIVLSDLRPELDLYLVTDVAVEDIAGTVSSKFRRIFYRTEDYLELHLSILRGVQSRYQTPFFTALKEYSRQPTGVFHAMPISRGKSLTKSHWIRDMVDFYGINIFLAETSTTSGGLDSLLQPHGPIKKAQELASRAFFSRRSYFVTNGTSTANKIVVQALVRPGDVVLVDRDCHKSHHYGMVLSGAQVHYLDSYPLHDFSMYGAVPLEDIKRTLLAYRAAGMLDRVRVLLLTNCTFDGVVYNVERVMEECLAIKPDLVFLWDEAWFAFAGCTPMYRRRTAMWTANRLYERYRSEAYRERYREWKEHNPLPEDDDRAWLETRLLPDPECVRVRAYSTQSTHKSLTSLRQGSMIHVYDQDFSQLIAEPFDEAFMTHTSTSPNYQIIASLDVGRRQVELEGYELVQKQLELAMALRERIKTHPQLKRWFRFLNAGDLIPRRFRPSGIDSYYDPVTGFRNNNVEEAWALDDFAVDPTRLTLYVGETGIDGDTFKNDFLMDKYGIQINKTSRNTVLFMTNIGTTRSSVAYLIGVLVKIADELERRLEDASPAERRILDARVRSLSKELPPLPDFSRFHDAFRTPGAPGAGNMRAAYFLAYDQAACDYLRIDDGSIEARIDAGEEPVSASFVIPYPPGFPILVPGQVISREIIAFMRALDVKEIHGYRPELGLQVFTPEALQARAEMPAASTAQVAAAISANREESEAGEDPSSE